jgi:phosphoglycolate phosphatase
MSRYDFVIFDWDGTVMDSTGLIASCIQDACRDEGIAVPSEEDARWVIGLGIAASMARIAPGITQDRQLALADRYRRHFLSREHEAPLFAGVREMLDDLRGRDRTLAVATGKARRGLERAFDSSGLRGHFDFSRCADEGHPKPHPDMVLWLLEQTGADPARTVLIGDTTHDLELAANAGIDAVGVCYGAHGGDTLRERPARHYAGSVAELRQWLAANA